MATIQDKNFSRLGGVDYRSSDVNRKETFAREVRNVEILSNESWGLRRGCKGHAPSAGGGGTKNYIHIDPTTQLAVEEIVTIDSNLRRLKAGTITVTYTGAGATQYVQIAPTDNGDGTYSYHCFVYDDGVKLLDVNLGTGLDNGSPVTVASLVTSIDGLTDFAASATGTTTGPAAFLPDGIYTISGGTAAISFSYWEQVYCPLTNPFSALSALFGTEYFELACLFNHAQRLFIATGVTSLYKYDSVSAYKAGMPKCTTLGTPSTSGTGLTGTYYWQITYEQIDALGVSVEGNPSNEVTLVLANQGASLTIPTIGAGDGYLTSCATVNGAQAGVTTITVNNSPHTLQVGQTAFFRDSGGTLQERLITARTATTITISGGAVSFSGGEVISANLRINLWRNKAGGSEKFLVKTFANNSLAASISFVDNVADSSLGAQMDFITTEHGLPPPNLRYLTSYNNLLIGSKGDDRVYFSDTDDPEYFDAANSSFLIKSKSNAKTTGLGSTREILCVFKQNETHLISGTDFEGGVFSVTRLSDKIGCDSHHSIIDIQGTIWFYSSDYGIRRVYRAQIPDEVGYRVNPRLTSKLANNALPVAHSRVIAYDIPRSEQAIFYFPIENASPAYAPSDNSFCLVGCYKDQFDGDAMYDDAGRVEAVVPKVSWWRWTGLNMGAGGDIYKGSLYWTERRYGSNISALEYPLTRRHELTDVCAYCDHAQPISLEYETHWIHGNAPDILKKYTQAVIYSFPPDGAIGFSIFCQTEIDFINDIAHSVKELVFGSGSLSNGWDNWLWDTIPWGEEIVPSVRFPFKLTRAKALKLKFYNTFWCQGCVISGYDTEIVPIYKPRVKP